ncbi:fibronectin [Enoplosus armatus]|uniref:fibronectin n=1 Tax=Enoplosus armatus TaxID=215367 RepID=UPI00399331C3
MHSAAQRENFLQSRNLTWEEARNHCQVCFKDLVTLTPEYIQTISPNLTSEYWVGLRKNFSSTNISWSQWANGDPLAYQNWYPGWPVFKSSFPRRDCCSCSCTCPAATTQKFTTAATMTTLPHVDNAAACVRSPMLLPDDVPDPDENYIEDSCVAMLSFGAWVEKNCMELLPFICYDAGTRYNVQVISIKCGRDLNPQEVTFYTTPNKVENLEVTNVTETSVYLSWSTPVGKVGFYLIKVHNRNILLKNNTKGKEVSNLTRGGLYTFTVLSGVEDAPVKWSEESSITKYTKPGTVSELMVSENTNSSLRLQWTPPMGNTTGYRVKAMDDDNNILYHEVVNQTNITVSNLTMGVKITLSVSALAGDTEEGDKVTVVNYTAPGPISNLNLSTTTVSLTAEWKAPDAYSSFTVKLQLDGENEDTIHNLTVPNACFNGLKTAANYTVTVYSVSGHIRGPPVGGSKFTLPMPPTDVTVFSHDKKVTIKWNAPVSTVTVGYSVKISSSFWGHSWIDILDDITNHTYNGLNSGTKYDFEVRTLADKLSSDPANASHTTDANKKEISLSMLCSSREPLLCDNTNTRESVFNQLQAHFMEHLRDTIVWKLERHETEN